MAIQRMSSTQKLIRKSLKGTLGIGDKSKMTVENNIAEAVGPANVDSVQYSEIINLSEQRSGLARSNYN